MKSLAVAAWALDARNRPSFFATPVAWATATFAAALIEEEGGIQPHHTAMIVVSDECSLETVRQLAQTAAQGAISPLRFAGASPSIVAGVPALQQGIRGPVIALTMRPEHASPAILALVEYWLTCGDIVAVVVIAHSRQGEREHLFKGLIARSATEQLSVCVAQLCEPSPAADRARG